MGLLDAIYASAGNLKPVSPPVGIYSHMMRDVETTLVLQESLLSISEDDFSIRDAKTQEAVLKCSGKMFSLHDRKKIYDGNGTLLYNMATKALSIGKAFIVEDAKGKDVLTIKAKWSRGSSLVADFYTAGEEHRLRLSGDFWGGTANIKDENGTALANISRAMLNVNEAVGDQQTYYVTIAPGVDIALIATLCIAFDETKNEKDDEEKEEDKEDK